MKAWIRPFLIGISLGMILLWCGLRNYQGKPYRTGTMKVDFVPNGVAGSLQVCVKTSEGNAVAGARVLVEDVSATSVRHTNSDGMVSFERVGNILVAIEVNEECIGRTTMFHQHNLNHGLTVICVKK
jgi:hypothetical protein